MCAVVQIPPADLLSVVWSCVVVFLQPAELYDVAGADSDLRSSHHRSPAHNRFPSEEDPGLNASMLTGFTGKPRRSLLGACWRSDCTSVGSLHTPTEIPARPQSLQFLCLRPTADKRRVITGLKIKTPPTVTPHQIFRPVLKNAVRRKKTKAGNRRSWIWKSLLLFFLLKKCLSKLKVI